MEGGGARGGAYGEESSPSADEPLGGVIQESYANMNLNYFHLLFQILQARTFASDDSRPSY